MRTVLPPRRTIVLKASRDTLVLLAAATGMTLAIGYSVHTRPAPDEPAAAAERAAAGEWTGQLAALTPSEAAASAPGAPLSSDALTVPKAAMALPVPPRATAALGTKPRPCDGPACPAKVAATPPVRHPATAHPQPVREASLIERFNPLNHLPDLVKRPFASAGDTIAGWVKRF